MKHLAAFLTFAGVLALGYCAYSYIEARLFQSQAALELAVKVPVPAGPTVRPYPRAGSAIAKLEIPRVKLSTIVVEGTADSELRVAAGHIRGTALPGDGGNAGVAAHRDTFFRPLRSIRVDDIISVETHERQMEYRVVSTKIVSPKDVQVLAPTAQETLTLVTCYPFNYVGAAPSRFIVRAECTNCGQ
jgi:sortase A